MTIFEEKSIGKAIMRLGLPAMLAQLATLIYNTADTYFVSLTKDANQIAAVTLSTPILLIIMSIACVFGMGGSSVIARLLGENNRKDSRLCFQFSTWAILAFGVLVAGIGVLCISPIAHAVGTDTNNYAYTCDYLFYIFLGAPFIMLSSGYAHLFRSVALIHEATVGVIIGNVLNIVLDWLFIVPLGMGTAGAALATSIGYFASTGYYLWCIYFQQRKGNDAISVSPKGLTESRILAGDTIKIGVPGALITVLLSVSKYRAEQPCSRIRFRCRGLLWHRIQNLIIRGAALRWTGAGHRSSVRFLFWCRAGGTAPKSRPSGRFP